MAESISELTSSYHSFESGRKSPRCAVCKLPPEYLEAVDNLLASGKPARTVAAWLESRGVSGMTRGKLYNHQVCNYHKEG